VVDEYLEPASRILNKENRVDALNYLAFVETDTAENIAEYLEGDQNENLASLIHCDAPVLEEQGLIEYSRTDLTPDTKIKITIKGENLVPATITDLNQYKEQIYALTNQERLKTLDSLGESGRTIEDITQILETQSSEERLYHIHLPILEEKGLISTEGKIERTKDGEKILEKLGQIIS